VRAGLQRVTSLLLLLFGLSLALRAASIPALTFELLEARFADLGAVRTRSRERVGWGMSMYLFEFGFVHDVFWFWELESWASRSSRQVCMLAFSGVFA
jgi:hypothetical protein